jgi:hypothetical protein
MEVQGRVTLSIFWTRAGQIWRTANPVLPLVGIALGELAGEEKRTK